MRALSLIYYKPEERWWKTYSTQCCSQDWGLSGEQ